MSGLDGESPGPRDLPDRLGFEHKEEITDLRASIQQRLDEVGAQEDDVVSLSTLDGKSMRVSARTYQIEPIKGDRKRWSFRRRKPIPEKVYYLNLPPDATTPPRSLSVYSTSIDGDQELMTHHSDPVKNIEIDFPLPRRLDGAQLRAALDEATAILADPLTVTLGEDALYASEQLGPSDTIRGQEALDLHEMVTPLFTDSLDSDPRTDSDARMVKLYAVHTDQAPTPQLEIHSVYVLPAPPNGVQTSIIFAGNPYGDGKHLSAHVNAKYGENNNPSDVEIHYLQDLPGDDSPLPKTTPIALDPTERRQVAEAIQRQVIPANLTTTPPVRS